VGGSGPLSFIELCEFSAFQIIFPCSDFILIVVAHLLNALRNGFFGHVWSFHSELNLNKSTLPDESETLVLAKTLIVHVIILDI